MTSIEQQNVTPRTQGLVLHGTARFYDVLAWLLMGGKEGDFREKILDLARLQSGEAVLDVGCGTGTLAIAAKQRVGPTGSVFGIDASLEMIARANKKAQRARLDIVFKNGVVEALPFPEGSFDAVLSTLMLHHLPREAREQCAREMRRVLKPGGRGLIVDFATSKKKKGLLTRLHPRHSSVKLHEIIGVLRQAGMNIVGSGPVGKKDTQFVLATAPST